MPCCILESNEKCPHKNKQVRATATGTKVVCLDCGKVLQDDSMGGVF